MILQTVPEVRKFFAEAVKAEREPYTAQHVADAFNMNVKVIRRHLCQKKLGGVKVGRDWEVTAKDIVEWRKRRRVT